MQKITFIFYSIFTFLSLAACSNGDDVEPQPQQLAVNYANMAGEWQLVSFNGTTLSEDTYVTIRFERRDHTFELRDNLNSMYGQVRTGSYRLTNDEKSETTILSGTYDNGVGAWSHEYTVTSLTDTELLLTTTDTPHESSVYRRNNE